ncbi:MAG: glycogen synthase GlgA [Candidatus Omnitrophota bacterium]
MKIAICASEVVPFAKTGGLADVTGALPLFLEKQGHEVVIIMPCYKSISGAKLNYRRLEEDISYSYLDGSINSNFANAKFSRGNPDKSFNAECGIKVYFIENSKYFSRQWLYGDKHGDYKDNLERFSFYCKRAIKLLKEIDFDCDIIHCHDWQSALIPVYLKAAFGSDKFFSKTKTLLTIHNMGYQGIFPKEQFSILGLEESFFSMDKLEFFGKINILKGGIVFSDYLSTVSPAYSKEIQTKEFGFGLEDILAKRKDSLSGILNGLDYSIWNPQADKIIAANYSTDDLFGKQKNKQDLQEICGFPKYSDLPLIGIVSRLAEQKGFDLLSELMDEICNMPLQLVILGIGDLKYHRIMEDIAKKYPKVMALFLKFDDQLAHKIYAGSDIFLMPSKYEPCGLGQLISLRYGTIPIVFKTGGLADTVTKERGFVFEQYEQNELLEIIKQSVDCFKDKDQWQKLMVNAMQCDFSWEESAREYTRLYEKARISA